MAISSFNPVLTVTKRATVTMHDSVPQFSFIPLSQDLYHGQADFNSHKARKKDHCSFDIVSINPNHVVIDITLSPSQIPGRLIGNTLSKNLWANYDWSQYSQQNFNKNRLFDVQ
ncbi:MAG: hypothetical protein WA125_17350 [Desulfosporosinus sp.]